MMFMEKLDDLKEFKAHLFGNLSCVMQEMGAWDADNMPNMKYYLEDMWAMMEEDLDPMFVEELKKKYQICEKFAEGLPTPDTPVAPFKKMFGKSIMFHNCALVRILSLYVA